MLPSYLHSWVNSTVRIGMFTPTPSVSVPQMIFSRPAWARRSTSSRYFGSRTRMVDADPADEEATERAAERRVEPEAADQRLDLLLLVLGERVEAQVACAASVASRWVKWTR